MKKISSSEVNRFLVRQEHLFNLQTPKFYHLIRQAVHLPYPYTDKSVLSLPSIFFQETFFLPYTLRFRFPSLFSPSGLPTHALQVRLFSPTLISAPSSSDHRNIWWAVQVTKLLGMKLSPVAYYLLLRGFSYLPQHPFPFNTNPESVNSWEIC
jgi:hypothetical protein